MYFPQLKLVSWLIKWIEHTVICYCILGFFYEVQIFANLPIKAWLAKKFLLEEILYFQVNKHYQGQSCLAILAIVEISARGSFFRVAKHGLVIITHYTVVCGVPPNYNLWGFSKSMTKSEICWIFCDLLAGVWAGLLEDFKDLIYTQRSNHTMHIIF